MEWTGCLAREQFITNTFVKYSIDFTHNLSSISALLSGFIRPDKSRKAKKIATVTSSAPGQVPCYE
jgi:hypothetical protein